MRDSQYPIFYRENRCVHCGKKDTLKPLNKFGSVNRSELLYPTSCLRCEACGRIYFIMWESEEDNTDPTIPVAVSKNYIDQFIEIVKQDT